MSCHRSDRLDPELEGWFTRGPIELIYATLRVESRFQIGPILSHLATDSNSYTSQPLLKIWARRDEPGEPSDQRFRSKFQFRSISSSVSLLQCLHARSIWKDDEVPSEKATQFSSACEILLEHVHRLPTVARLISGRLEASRWSNLVGSQETIPGSRNVRTRMNRRISFPVPSTWRLRTLSSVAFNRATRMI